jgi:hypothetical protein
MSGATPLALLHSCTSHVTQRFTVSVVQHEDVLRGPQGPRCCLCPTGNKQRAVGRSDPGEAGCTLQTTLQTTLLQQRVGPGAALRRRCEERHSSRLADVSGQRDWEGGVLPLLGYLIIIAPAIMPCVALGCCCCCCCCAAVWSPVRSLFTRAPLPQPRWNAMFGVYKI